VSGWTARLLWKTLSPEQRRQVALSLWNDRHLDRMERAQALLPWLSARGIRVTYLEKLSRDKRAETMAAGGLPEETASQALRSFHLTERRELLGKFLDLLDIPNDDGLITEDFDTADLGEEKVSAAVAGLRESFSAADVDLYIRTLVATDRETWSVLSSHAGSPPT